MKFALVYTEKIIDKFCLPRVNCICQFCRCAAATTSQTGENVVI